MNFYICCGCRGASHYPAVGQPGAQTVRTIAKEGIGIELQAESILPKDTEAYFKYPVKPQINTDFVLIANKFGVSQTKS